jgi:hypothetical protein
VPLPKLPVPGLNGTAGLGEMVPPGTADGSVGKLGAVVAGALDRGTKPLGGKRGIESAGKAPPGKRVGGGDMVDPAGGSDGMNVPPGAGTVGMTTLGCEG